MKKQNNVHIGQEIKKVFLESKLSPDEFAKLIGCTRSNVYNIFNNPNVRYEQLKNISEALDHDFMYLLGAEGGNTSQKNSLGTGKAISEHIPGIDTHSALDDKDFACIVSEYVSGDYSKPLVVLAYNCSDVAHSIAYEKAREVHGALVSRNTTDLQSFRYTPFRVHIVSEKTGRDNGEDVNVYLGKVLEAKSKGDSHLIYIIDIPRYNLDSIEEYSKLENKLKQRHSIWDRYVHMVCLDSTQSLTEKRKSMEHGRTFFGFDQSIAAHLCKLSENEIQKINESSQSIVYSEDGKRLLRATVTEDVFEIKEGVEQICNEAFANNSLLRKVVMPESTRTIGRNAFTGCSSLLQVIMPRKMTGLCEACFAGCTQLAKVQMPEELQYIGKEAFEGCSSLKQIDIPETLHSIEEGAFNNTGLVSLTLRHKGNEVCSIGSEVFANCRSLVSVSVSANIDISEASVFAGCNSLRDFTLIGHRHNAGELIGGLSVQCPSLETITYKLK